MISVSPGGGGLSFTTAAGLVSGVTRVPRLAAAAEMLAVPAVAAGLWWWWVLLAGLLMLLLGGVP
jgi:hypothetical protein